VLNNKLVSELIPNKASKSRYLHATKKTHNADFLI